jgi:sodium pump decarboxylase gamma subunit|tara:strand:- start:4317 stop:4544 length:228 start_codon:yes stop_codon:yes gene_type:complete
MFYEMIQPGIMLMYTGMSVVFLFLLVLITVTKSMTLVVSKFSSQNIVPTNQSYDENQINEDELTAIKEVIKFHES